MFIFRAVNHKKTLFPVEILKTLFEFENWGGGHTFKCTENLLRGNNFGQLKGSAKLVKGIRYCPFFPSD